MADPRWINLKTPRQLLLERQPGLGSGEDFRILQTETNRRRKAAAAAQVAKPAPRMAPQNPPTTPPFPPVPVTPDRFHKTGKIYATVSPAPDFGDPVPDPAAFHTISAGYAFLRDVRLAQIGIDERAVLFVFGGLYKEIVTFDSSRIDVIGIGKPIIDSTTVVDPLSGPAAVTIKNTCTQILFENFKVINPDGGEGSLGFDMPGLTIEDGLESGTHISDIQIVNCDFYGSRMNAFINRWSYFDNCTFKNVQGAIPQDTLNPSVWVTMHPDQLHVTEFQNCRIYGYNKSESAWSKGPAITCGVMDRFGGWVASGTNAAVKFSKCIIQGWGQQYGGTLLFDSHCEIYQGDFINLTSGSVFLHIYSYSTSDSGGINAYTMFDHTKTAQRYLADVNDVGPFTPGGGSVINIWTQHSKHVQPEPDPAGGLIHLSFAGHATGVVNVYGEMSGTARAFLWAGGGAVELALVANCSIGGAIVNNVVGAVAAGSIYQNLFYE